MKSKKVLSFVLTFGILLLFSVTVFAMAAGMPETQGLPGDEFGATVSALAQSEPGEVAAHVATKPDMQNSNSDELEADESEMAGGIPAALSLTGEEFGAAVSALAQSEPGAVAAHVANKPDMQNSNSDELEADESEMAAGMPETQSLPGDEFGAAVSALAQSEPGEVAAHVANKMRP